MTAASSWAASSERASQMTALPAAPDARPSTVSFVDVSPSTVIWGAGNPPERSRLWTRAPHSAVFAKLTSLDFIRIIRCQNLVCQLWLAVRRPSILVAPFLYKTDATRAGCDVFGAPLTRRRKGRAGDGRCHDKFFSPVWGRA